MNKKNIYLIRALICALIVVVSFSACSTTVDKSETEKDSISEEITKSNMEDNTEENIEENEEDDTEEEESEVENEEDDTEEEEEDMSKRGMILGGYEVNEGDFSLDENEYAKEAFEKATEKSDNYKYESMGLLATQVVAGTNYTILCRVTPESENEDMYFAVVYIYADLDGNAEIKEIQRINP